MKGIIQQNGAQEGNEATESSYRPKKPKHRPAAFPIAREHDQFSINRA